MSYMGEREALSFRFHFIAAASLYVLDGIFFGQGVLAFLVMAGFLLSWIFEMSFRAAKNQPATKAPLKKFAIYACCFVSVASTIAANNEIARSRADNIISAVKQYRAKTGEYPIKLDVLVPEYLASVPNAKYTVALNKFFYWPRRIGNAAVGTLNEAAPEEGALLMYVAFPPFWRPTYYFEQDRWN